MWKPKSREERELGPELGEGEVKTIEDLRREEAQKKSGTRIFAEILILLAVLLSGFLVAFLVAKVNGASFGFYTWPLIACTDVFVFTTIGQKEKLKKYMASARLQAQPALSCRWQYYFKR